jgi:hypothetical protein
VLFGLFFFSYSSFGKEGNVRIPFQEMYDRLNSLKITSIASNIIVAGDKHRIPDEVLETYKRNISENFKGKLIVERTIDDYEFQKFFDNIKGEPVNYLIFIGFHGRNIVGPEFGFQLENHIKWYSFMDLFETMNIDFAPNAMIVFWNCNLTEDDNRIAIMDTSEIASALKMKSGWIYVNRTAGGDPVDSLYKTPFYSVPQIGPMFSRLLMQASWPLSLPIAYFTDNFLINQGFLYGFEENSNQSTLLRIDYKTARNGIENVRKNGFKSDR